MKLYNRENALFIIECRVLLQKQKKKMYIIVKVQTA